jgi:hypothetical protein
MEHLPFELLDRILKSACTDNGRTGCALSAVSHHVRDASAYMRYHSVALQNPKQICAFVIMLNDIREREKPSTLARWRQRLGMKKSIYKGPKPTSQGTSRMSSPVVHVHHLFLADHSRGSPLSPSLPMWSEWYCRKPETLSLPSLVEKVKGTHEIIFPRYLSRDEYRNTSQTYMRTCETIISDLLIRIAPTLLHLSYHESLPSSALLHVRFSALVELSCYFSRPDTMSIDEISPPIHLRTQFPCLERLHAMVDRDYDGGFTRLPLAGDVPATLSLVLISAIYGDSKEVVELMTRHQDRPWVSQHGFDIFLLDTYVRDRPELSLLTLPPNADHGWPKIWVPSRFWYSTQPTLKDMEHKIYVLRDEYWDFVHPRCRLYREWLSRVHGEEGLGKEVMRVRQALGVRTMAEAVSAGILSVDDWNAN